MKFNFVHDFEIDPAGYWKIFLDEDFNNELYKKMSVSRKTVKREDDGQIFARIVRYQPETLIPPFLIGLVTDTSYTEINQMAWPANLMTVVVEPAILREFFQTRADYIVSPLDDGKRCRREFKGEVRVNFPMLGGAVEDFIVTQMRANVEISARHVRLWLDKKGPTAG